MIMKGERSNMKGRVRFALCLFSAALIALFLYILIHECGHMIVMLSAGATITDFSILGAHVSSVGGDYTNTSDLWMNANGALLPLILSYVYMLFYKRSLANTFYRILSYMISLVPTASLLAWVILPILYMNGNAPAGDDVTKFLFNFSQSYDPIYVSVAALLLIMTGITIMVIKGIPQNFCNEAKSIRVKEALS